MAAGGLRSDNRGCYLGASGGKRISICITSILPDLVLCRWLIVELYRNIGLCNFWCVRLLLAHEFGRYQRFFTGTIIASVAATNTYHPIDKKLHILWIVAGQCDTKVYKSSACPKIRVHLQAW